VKSKGESLQVDSKDTRSDGNVSSQIAETQQLVVFILYLQDNKATANCSVVSEHYEPRRS